MKKPVISWYKSGNPCAKFDWVQRLTEINIIRTKTISDEFIDACIQNKHRLFLHVVITGMGQTPFEPLIPTVKTTFFQLQKLIVAGFSQKQILVVVENVLSNENGLKAIKLLLRVFTEFKPLRLRFIKFSVLNYRQLENGNYVIANPHILKRQGIKGFMEFLTKSNSFWKDYYKLIEDYQTIISVDKGEESLIGIRELRPFGLNNSWTNENGTKEKLINYENGNRYKPDVNIISGTPIRCSNKCLLCPYRF